MVRLQQIISSYACIYCNLQKGSDLGSINWQTGELVRFFNPRRDFWGEHFRLNEAVIEPLGDIGEVGAQYIVPLLYVSLILTTANAFWNGKH